MPRTDDLPGVQGEGVTPKKVKRLDNAIEKWRLYVSQRMDVLKLEVEARNKVVSIMHEEGLKTYPYWIDDDEQRVAVLDSTEKLKLKKPKDEDAEGDDDSGTLND